MFVTVAEESDTVALQVTDHGVGGADQSVGLGPARPGRPGRGRRRNVRRRQPTGPRHDDQLPGPGPRCCVPEQTVRETVMEPVS